MALIPCKECGTEMSTKATACPKCGARMPRKWGGSSPSAVLLAFAILIAIVYGALTAALPAQEPECTMNGFGQGSCIFTNSYPFPWRTCGRIIVERGSKEVARTETFCSGFVGPKSSVSMPFSAPYTRDGCETELPKRWSDVCGFTFKIQH